MPADFLVAVHCGAGYHSPAQEPSYCKAMGEACQAAAAALAGGGDALAAVEAAIKVLEDCPVTNAGKGSNLSWEGRVECDASVMDGSGAFGAVGAVPGLANPIRAAAALAREGQLPLSHGRVRPMVLAGERAREWAAARGVTTAASAEEEEASLITERARRQWRKWRDIVEAGGRGGPAQQQHAQQQEAVVQQGEGLMEEEEEQRASAARDTAPAAPVVKRARRQKGVEQRSTNTADGTAAGSKDCDGSALAVAAPAVEEAECLLDTVGCVVVAPDGSLAAGVSSGGIALKAEGRVGEAAAYGAGCWAQPPCRRVPESAPGVACSVTGVGERIMRHLIAREAAAAVATQSATTPVCDSLARVLRATVLCGAPPPDCGVLCLRVAAAADGDGGTQHQHLEVELGVAHCAQSMAVGWLAGSTHGSSLDSTRPEVLVLRRSSTEAVQNMTQGVRLRIVRSI